jgi:SNF2 family DNA or RNA helicase
MLKDMLDDLVSEGRKVLIFSQFVQSLNIIKEEIEQRKLPFSYIDGSTKNRGAEIDKFQNNPDINIFLLSLKAGGVGINLTSADCVILFDPWWNPALEAQAVDRAHRIGQTKKVTAFRMIVKDTIEEKILALQDKKRTLVNDLITEEASFFKSLTGDDIMDLFS